LQRTGPTAGGRAGALQASRLRGRPYGSRRGDPRGGARLHLIDTLRAAAPWQGLRRREGAAAEDAADSGPRATLRVLVRRDDFHIGRFRQRRETTTLFVVDASGSAALHRLAEAKGAVELLLADCYVRRDKVALMAFRGQAGGGTELLLPPTRSLVRAKRCLAALPGGGGTPLASALDAARELTEEVARRGGTPLAVFLTDGRANIARDGGSGRERATADAMLAARRWQGSGVGALWLDTAPQPQAQAQQLALAMGARYLPLPHADAQQMSRAVQALR
uniref:VWA domain-containing protein n=1 Tax=Ideonella sp. A 288 TaxID=1962181 RepID=UPI001186107D